MSRPHRTSANGTWRVTAKTSKVELRAELEHSWIKRRCHLAEVAGAQAIAHRVKLGVIPNIKAFRAKFESPVPILTERETLEQGEIPVVAPGRAQRIETRIAPGAHNWRCERRCVEPLPGLVRIRNAANPVRAVGGVRQAIAALPSSQLRVDRQSGCHGNDSGHFPRTKRRSQESVGTLLQKGNVIDEVNSAIVRSVIAAWSAVIFPTQVWIGNVGQIGATSAP